MLFAKSHRRCCFVSGLLLVSVFTLLQPASAQTLAAPVTPPPTAPASPPASPDSQQAEVVFAAQPLPSPSVLTQLARTPTEHEDAANVSETQARTHAAAALLPTLEAQTLFTAGADDDTNSCSTLAQLATQLQDRCHKGTLRPGDRQLVSRLLHSAGEPHRTESWSKDTERLFSLATCAGSAREQQEVVEAALQAATASLAHPSLAAQQQQHAQRAHWLWSYRLTALKLAHGQQRQAEAALYRLQQTAPTQELQAKVAGARQLLRLSRTTTAE